MYDVIVRTERLGTDSGPALNINRAAAIIDTVVMHGNHTGLIWNGDNNGNFPSSLSNAQLSGSTCLLLVEHTYISGSDNLITPQCSGTITLQDSQVNWSKFTDLTQSTIINLDSFLHCIYTNQLTLHWQMPTLRLQARSRWLGMFLCGCKITTPTEFQMHRCKFPLISLNPMLNKILTKTAL